MKEHGLRTQSALKSIKLFFGARSSDKDGEKFAKALENTAFPEMENCEKTPEELDALCDQAEKLLHLEYPAPKSQRMPDGICIKQLGNPRRLQPQELKKQLSQMSEAVCRALTGYEETLELSIIQEGQGETRLRLADARADSQALASIIRSVYSQVKTEACPETEEAYGNRLYASISLPFRDNRQEEEKNGEKNASNWVDDILHALPAMGSYRVDVRFSPLESYDRLLDQQQQLQQISDALKMSGEADWNHSDTLGVQHKRENNLAENLGDVGRGIISGTENISSNYSSVYSWTRHQKNKRAEFLSAQIDQKIYRLEKALQSGAWQVELSVSTDDDLAMQSICSCLKGALQKDRYILSWSDEPGSASILSSEELLPLLRFPTQPFSGFDFMENEDFSLVSPAEAGDGIEMGNILWNGFATAPFSLPRGAFNRHAFICGMTGAGKTNTLFKILEKANVPFLVIEPVKGEYRSLSAPYPDLKIFTMKTNNQPSENLSILRINPFWFPENASISFHIDSLKTIIASAFDMSNAMPNILEQCMYNIYIKAGWNIITNKNRYAGQIPDEFLYPTFSDLMDEVEEYLDHSKFVGETLGDYHGAMTTRLKSFVNSYKGLLLNTQAHPDYEQMMNGRAIIELEGLADDADKCLVMGTILVQYFEYLKLHFRGSSKGLRHLMVIEEAHRLFKNVQKQQGGGEIKGADPTGQLVDTLSNIMAEIRAFGEGLLIVDQSPSKIAEDVIKNSSTKIIHRIDNAKDIEMLQSALLLHEDKTSMPALALGEALIRSEGMRKPCKIKVHRSEIKESYQLSDSFQNGRVSEEDMQHAFAAMAILADDDLAEDVRSLIWMLLIALEQNGFEAWDKYMDEMLRSLVEKLMDRRKYDLVDGNAAVIRSLFAQSIRGLRNGTSNDISVYELGALHLFFQSLWDLYAEKCSGIPTKEGNIRLMERFFEMNIAPISHARMEEIEENLSSDDEE